jgi:hypothetical protein
MNRVLWRPVFFFLTPLVYNIRGHLVFTCCFWFYSLNILTVEKEPITKNMLFWLRVWYLKCKPFHYFSSQKNLKGFSKTLIKSDCFLFERRSDATKTPTGSEEINMKFNLYGLLRYKSVSFRWRGLRLTDGWRAPIFPPSPPSRNVWFCRLFNPLLPLRPPFLKTYQ